MKQYFASAFTVREETEAPLPRIRLAREMECLEESSDQPKAVVNFGEKQFCMLPDMEMPEEYLVTGYLTVTKRDKKRRRLHRDNVAAVEEVGELYPITGKQHGEVLGYLKSEEENRYIAVTRRESFFPLLLPPCLLTILYLWLYFFWTPIAPPVQVSDPITEGGLTPSIAANLDPAYFNIKVNATPIIKDGQMNLRVENSERNLYNCTVEVELRQDGEPETIYSSALIQPNRTLEYTTVETDCAPGVYDGSAVFRFYDDESTLIGNANVKLIINIM